MDIKKPLKLMTTKKARKKWLKVLADPDSRKAKKTLEKSDGSRCCLGHACHALLPEEREVHFYKRKNEKAHIFYDTHGSTLPPKVTELLDIECEGTFVDPLRAEDVRKYRDGKNLKVKGCKSRKEQEAVRFDSLVAINDDTNLTPQQIGRLIADQFKRDNFEPHAIWE